VETTQLQFQGKSILGVFEIQVGSPRSMNSSDRRFSKSPKNSRRQKECVFC